MGDLDGLSMIGLQGSSVPLIQLSHGMCWILVCIPLLFSAGVQLLLWIAALHARGSTTQQASVNWLILSLLFSKLRWNPATAATSVPPGIGGLVASPVLMCSICFGTHKARECSSARGTQAPPQNRRSQQTSLKQWLVNSHCCTGYLWHLSHSFILSIHLFHWLYVIWHFAFMILCFISLFRCSWCHCCLLLSFQFRVAVFSSSWGSGGGGTSTQLLSWNLELSEGGCQPQLGKGSHPYQPESSGIIAMSSPKQVFCIVAVEGLRRGGFPISFDPTRCNLLLVACNHPSSLCNREVVAQYIAHEV